jgi:nicotinamidase/pyrazinamidase
MKSAFFIIDPQNTFCALDSNIPGTGELPVEDAADVIARINSHLTRNYYDYVIASKCWHILPGDHWSETPDYKTTWPRHGEAGSEGAEFHPNLTYPLDAVFAKGLYSAAYSAFEGNLCSEGVNITSHITTEEWLVGHEVGTIYFGGVELVNCVEASLKSAIELDKFTCVLVPSLCAALEPDKAVENWSRIQKETKCLISSDY